MTRLRKIAAGLLALVVSASVVPSAIADEDEYEYTPPISFTNVQVTDIGAHTANVSFDYQINEDVSQIESLCFIIDVQKITAVQYIKQSSGLAWGPYWIQCGTEGETSDADLTSESYERIYGVRHDEGILRGTSKADYAAFYRAYNSAKHPEVWSGQKSGHKNLSLIGLQPNTEYGNKGNDNHCVEVNLLPTIDKLRDAGNHNKVAVDIQQLLLGAYIDYKHPEAVDDNGCFENNAVKIPSFTTAAAPVGANQDKLDAADANKLTVDGNTAQAGSPARIYINDLKEEARKKVDGDQSVFWYSYIYSDPVALRSKSGAPFVTINKDDQGRYYYDALIPANYAGEHRISVQDEHGAVQGWTTISVKPQKIVFTDVNGATPHHDDIVWLADNGISTGWPMADGTYVFRGMDTVKRQDMAAFLRRLAVKYDIAGAKDFKPTAADWKRFRDVNAKTPHAEDILWLASTGISTGWKESNGSFTFRGMDTVKRQDMAAFLYRLADKGGKAGGVNPKTDFTDVTATTPHCKEVQWLGGSGISQGYRNPNGTWRFEGMTSVYRQDMAAFLHRLNERLTK